MWLERFQSILAIWIYRETELRPFYRNEAKEWARENMRGIWAAALTPFTPGSLAIDEAAVRRHPPKGV